jgi:serine/threonine protein kinase
MFRADGSLALVDFGVAKHIYAARRTSHGKVFGTPYYMSPEQVRGIALDPRTDIYSAGVLLYEMLVGHRLFDGDTPIQAALRHVDTVPPPLPDNLAQYQCLLDKLLEKDRNARFRNADEAIGFMARKFGGSSMVARAAAAG